MSLYRFSLSLFLLYSLLTPTIATYASNNTLDFPVLVLSLTHSLDNFNHTIILCIYSFRYGMLEHMLKLIAQSILTKLLLDVMQCTALCECLLIYLTATQHRCCWLSLFLQNHRKKFSTSIIVSNAYENNLSGWLESAL